MLNINDPVGTGLVESLARPGGFTTGMASLSEDLTPKILEFQREVVPKASVIAGLFNPANPKGYVTEPFKRPQGFVILRIDERMFAKGIDILPAIVAGEIEDSHDLHGEAGYWTFTVDPAGFAGQFKITLDCHSVFID